MNHTHLLVLNAVGIAEPVNGYQIRRELMSWRVDEWANVNPGSIYHSLATLTKRGLLTRHDLDDNRRTVAVYETTTAGREQRTEWLLEALRDVDFHDRVGFQIAFSALPNLTREQVIPALEQRLSTLTELLEEFRTGVDPTGLAPPHARRGWALWLALAEAELVWLTETIRLIRDRALPFETDEDWGWQPAPDDPGWQMVHDQARYRELLDGR